MGIHWMCGNGCAGWRAVKTGMAALVVVSLVASLAACGIKAPRPETPRQRLAYIEGAYSSVLQTLDTMKDNGMLEQWQIKAIGQYAHEANEALDAAHRVIEQPGKTRAAAKLEIVNEILWELRRIKRGVQ